MSLSSLLLCGVGGATAAAPPAPNTHSIDLEISSTQYLSRADASLVGLDITGDMTVEMWVKRESDVTGNLAGKWNSTGDQRSWIFQYSTSQGLYFATSANGVNALDGAVAQTLNTGTWYHVAAAYDASAGTCEIFVNGSSIGTISSLATSLFNSSAPFEIGHFTSSGTYYDGLIDDVRVWDSLRSSAEISANYQTQIDSATNLQGSWHLNNALTDSSGNGNTLTNNGSAVFSADVPFA